MRLKTASMIKILVLVGISFFVASCDRGAQSSVKTERLYGQNEIRYATGLRMVRRGDRTFVTVVNRQDTLHPYAVYCLVHQDTAQVPAGMTKVVVPVGRMIPTSATHYEPLTLLGELQSVVGVCSGERIYNNFLRGALRDGKIKNLGDNYSMNRESLMALQPDVVMYSLYAANDNMMDLMQRCGLTVVLNQEWEEQTLLGRAEWIKLFGALYDKQTLADSLFEAMVRHYDEVKLLAAKATTRPKVMSGCGFHGSWYVPGGQSYMANLYADAGATYRYAQDENSGSITLNLEQILTEFADADYWFGAQGEKLADVLAEEPRVAKLRAVKAGQVYSYGLRSTPEGGSDFWEGCISHPDSLLADVVAVLHPELLPQHKFVYMNQLK